MKTTAEYVNNTSEDLDVSIVNDAAVALSDLDLYTAVNENLPEHIIAVNTVTESTKDTDVDDWNLPYETFTFFATWDSLQVLLLVTTESKEEADSPTDDSGNNAYNKQDLILCTGTEGEKHLLTDQDRVYLMNETNSQHDKKELEDFINLTTKSDIKLKADVEILNMINIEAENLIDENERTETSSDDVVDEETNCESETINEDAPKEDTDNIHDPTNGTASVDFSRSTVDSNSSNATKLLKIRKYTSEKSKQFPQ